jgi:alkylhydroperoxidase family enzyme
MEQRLARDGRQTVGEDKLGQLVQYETSPLFSERERVALRYADAITWDPNAADAAMWEDLHRHFTEPELVEMGQCLAMHAGEQRWIHTLHIRHGEFMASTDAGLTARGALESDQTSRDGESGGGS